MQHSPESWRRIKDLFGVLAEEGHEERERRLSEEGQKDPALAAEVRALLEVQGRGEALVSRLVEEEARGVMSGALHPLAPGTRLGAYEIEGHLGTGGMGAVFLARRADSEYESHVAIKLVRPGLFSEEALQRFRTERQTLATLNHPNIARLLDGGTTPDGLPYLVMEYVEGEPLDAFCAKRNLSLEERLRLFRVVCEAVSHAHRNLIVHRDIKPGNILVSQPGEVKLLDFGIAKLLGNAGETAGLTRTGERVLTPDYASPEQVRGGRVTTGSDVYSLGVLLYRLLTGQPPYRLPADRPSEAERIICEQTPEKPSTAVTRADGDAPPSAQPFRLRRRLRGDLDNIVLKALRKEPERRYGTVDEMSEDIRRHLAGLPVSARRETLGYLAGRFFARHRLAAGAAALVVASLAVGIVVANRQARRAEREQKKAERIRDFVTGMLSAADPSWYSKARAAGAGVTVAQVLDEAAARAGTEFAAEPEVEAAVRRTLGRSYQALGRYDAAGAQLGRTLELHRRLFPESHPEVARSAVDLAHIHFLKGDYAKAEPLFRAGETTARALAPAADEVLAIALNGRALVLWIQGDPRTAEPLLTETVAILRRLHGEKHGSIAVALGNMGLMRDEQGDIDGAEARYREAIAVLDALPGRPLSEKGFSLLNLGSVMRVRGRLEEAEQLLRSSLEVWRTTIGEDHSNAANSRIHLARVLHLRGDSPAAHAEIENALDILRRKLPPGHLEFAKAETVQGLVLCGSGRPREGEAVLRRALGRRRGALPAGDWRIGETAGELGWCLAAQGRDEEARPLLEESHRSLEAKMGRDNPRTREAEERLALLDQAKLRSAGP